MVIIFICMTGQTSQYTFDGKLRDGLLNREIFATLTEVSILIEQLRKEYNLIRSHSSLSYRSPAPEAIIPVTLT